MVGVIIALGLLALGVPGGYISYCLWRSKLHVFNQPTLLFRVLYALYTSPIGQLLHSLILSNHDNANPHTKPCKDFILCGSCSIAYVPFLGDNYAYFIIDNATGETAVVDPADADLVIQEFSRLSALWRTSHDTSLALAYVLATHKHQDHSGGNKQLALQFPLVEVVGGVNEEIPGRTVGLAHNESVNLGATTIKALETPCHTVGHIAYLVTSSDAPERPGALFSGDTLFVGGVGKFFEGNPTLMYHSLYSVLSLDNVPPETKLFPGHEYAVSNLEFCRLVEPNNEQATAKLRWAHEQRDNDLPAIPTTMEEEYSYNVFLRANERTVAARCELPTSSGAQIVGKLRRWKDTNALTH